MFTYLGLLLLNNLLIVSPVSIGSREAANLTSTSLPEESKASPLLKEAANLTSTSLSKESNESLLLKEYEEKICKNEPTCHMVNQMPSHMRDFPIRNCMCDAECSKYGDCCSDSPYYNETEQRINYKQFYCLPSAFWVYSIVSCPPTYSNVEVKSKCYLSTTSVKNDTKIMTPVTDVQRGITYGNEYCALCNGVTQFRVWNVLFICTDSVSSPDSINMLKTKHAHFDPVTNQFISINNGTRFLCDDGRILQPSDIQVRSCMTGMISTCPSGVNSKLCESQYAFGYIMNGTERVSYKNKYCAECNGVTGSITPCLYLKPSPKSYSSLFQSPVADTNGCGSLQADEEVKKKFCS